MMRKPPAKKESLANFKFTRQATNTEGFDKEKDKGNFEGGDPEVPPASMPPSGVNSASISTPLIKKNIPRAAPQKKLSMRP